VCRARVGDGEKSEWERAGGELAGVLMPPIFILVLVTQMYKQVLRTYTFFVQKL
jgi:cytochrome c oxidase subunit IV